MQKLKCKDEYKVCFDKFGNDKILETSGPLNKNDMKCRSMVSHYIPACVELSEFSLQMIAKKK